jgi:hypothetical protein
MSSASPIAPIFCRVFTNGRSVKEVAEENEDSHCLALLCGVSVMYELSKNMLLFQLGVKVKSARYRKRRLDSV